MGIWHLTYSSLGRQVIFPGEVALLEGVHAIVRGARGCIVLFCVVDDHLHIVIAADDVSRVTPGLRRALCAATATQLEPTHQRAIESRSHLSWLAKSYILDQPRKHGLPAHPALWPGSCFLDLVGARRIEGLTLQLGKVLPRFRLRQAFVAVGLEPQPLIPMSSEELRHVGAARLVRAAAASVGAAAWNGRSSRENAARRIAAGLALLAGLSSGDLAHTLRIRGTSVRRLMCRPPALAELRPARLLLTLEERVRRASGIPGAASS